MKLRYQEGTQVLAKLIIIQPKVKLTSYKCWFRRLHFTKERWEYIYHSNTIKLRELRELKVLEPSINKSINHSISCSEGRSSP